MRASHNPRHLVALLPGLVAIAIVFAIIIFGGHQ